MCLCHRWTSLRDRSFESKSIGFRTAKSQRVFLTILALQLQRGNHRSLLEQSTYLVTHYYLIRLPMSLLLIAVCILTPFAITWKLPFDASRSYQGLPYSIQNLTLSQDDLNQV